MPEETGRSQDTRCACDCCRLRGVMWPVILITLGVLFLIGQYSHRFSFADLWPIILIVIGIVKIAEAMASREGHIGS